MVTLVPGIELCLKVFGDIEGDEVEIPARICRTGVRDLVPGISRERPNVLQHMCGACARVVFYIPILFGGENLWRIEVIDDQMRGRSLDRITPHRGEEAWHVHAQRDVLFRVPGVELALLAWWWVHLGDKSGSASHGYPFRSRIKSATYR